MPRRPEAPSDRARRFACIAIGLLGIATVVAAALWRQERSVAASDTQLQAQTLALFRDEDASAASLAKVGASSPPRLLLSDALYRARALRRATGPDREAALTALSRQTDLAIEARPHWGHAWVVKAYIESLRQGPDHRLLALAALSRSYADSPFLRDAAGWRVTFALGHWDELDAFVRKRAIEEAVWLSRVDAGSRRAIFAAARNTNGYQPLVLRWRDVRLSDGDYFAAPVARRDPD